MQDYIVPMIIGAIVLLAIIIFMCNYIKVPPNVALIVSGRKKKYKTKDETGKSTMSQASPSPITTNYGVSDFSSTFPNRINAFVEDVTNNVPREYIRASGRDALATLEYTFAAIKSYENGGELVIPEMLPPIRGHVSFIK